MFTEGQLIFTGFFVVAFILALVYSYRKDLKLHRRYYKGSIFVLIAFLTFLGLLFVIKSYTR